jgi:hypothetical protein
MTQEGWNSSNSRNSLESRQLYQHDLAPEWRPGAKAAVSFDHPIVLSGFQQDLKDHWSTPLVLPPASAIGESSRDCSQNSATVTVWERRSSVTAVNIPAR